MRLQNTFIVSILSYILLSGTSYAQSNQYKRAEPAKPKAQAPAAKAGAAKPAPGKKDEKLDITDLEEKYWAPKDTDFSVVQNRTYTKEKRYSLSLLTGPIVNDPFNSGLNHSLSVNYYFSERYGVEFMYIHSDLKNSKAIKNFKGLSSGGVLPDYNRPKSYMGVGFNWVPFYAKVSFLGKKIIYFDMQVTPHIGFSTYEQIVEAPKAAEEPSVLSYGVDITQYFFFSKTLALRANLHNRWYKEDVRPFRANNNDPDESDLTNITNFLIGVTLFY